jgi:hypothetical protein
MMPPEFSKGRRRRGCTTQLHKNSSNYEKEEKEKNNHTIRAYDLSEIVETWPIRLGFLHQALGQFIALRCRRDNYKTEMKSIRCIQSKNSFPLKVADKIMGRHAVIRFPKFRSWL